MAQVEQDLWKSVNDDDTRENFQTTKDKDDEDEDDCLNDDDIEEIIIFQTQSLQRKGSEGRVDEREYEKSKHLPLVDTEEEVISADLTCTNILSKFGDDVSGDKRSFLTSEETQQELGKPLKDDVLSRCPVEEGNLRNPLEKYNLSDSPVDEDSVSRNRVEGSCLSRNPSEDSGDIAEEDEKVELIMSCTKENIVEEDVMIGNEQLPLREVSVRRKQFRQEREYFEENQLLSASSIERACVQEGEPISDSDDVEAQPEDHMQESSERSIVERNLKKSYGFDEEVSHVEGSAEVDYELQNDADCTHIYDVSADLLNGQNEVEYGDCEEKDVSEKNQDTLPDLNRVENKDVNLYMEGSKKLPDEPISLPSGDGRWDDEEVFQGSPGEVTVPYDVESDDEMEEMALNESITLISDNEQEVCFFVFVCICLLSFVLCFF